MSLSKTILEGTFAEVEKLVNAGAPINISDEYGYSPIVHAIVTHRVDVVRLLLKNNAMVDIVDVTGSTPLHWAVDVNDVEITKLLLYYGANPNAYTENGQPVLFYPLLRKNTVLIKLLTAKGASLDFAKDFINAKLIGHRFELQGSTDVINAAGLYLSIDLEGFYLELTLSVIRESVERFINSYVARRMDIHEPELKLIIEAFKNAYKLREFKHFTSDVEARKSEIYPLLDVDLLLLPVSYKGHAITFIKHGNMLAKCDRGVFKMTDPIVIHTVGNERPLQDHDFLIDLLYKRQTEKSMKSDIYKILDLEPYAKLPIKHQITGNCSWANAESSIPTMLYMLLHDKITDQSKVPALVGEIMTFYRAWLEWDKDRAIEDWMENFETMTFARQKTKAALLGAVLFQALKINSPTDVQRAQKILKILARKEFNYIVRAYANVFIRGGRSNAEGINFQNMIELCGYKLSQFNG
ncbi:Dot/Icm T4SS effector AnkH/LegA3 [Candidatus Berkiella aquae]|uniref:Ankyrin repeat domain-containing protein n=1 Tax=Candidatus Berkiella aquae TaxID=295108 RepID=A0A0Q9YJQ3_9GAMM|nr:Dot/Icm T4SS effector AnkH/LegA3 [Candidatus Berkiella aquae]MCS5711363.1 ankyrin repeat domain-containing protein [Candidatus Berkiella aquae]